MNALIADVAAALNASNYGSYEIIMVVDGSPDDTWALIIAAAKEHDYVRGINLMRNYGQHSALLAGIRAAHGNVIVTMDDDFQHSPTDIPLLVESLNDGVDIVYGVSVDEEHSFARNISSRTYKRFAGILLRAEGAEIAGAFRAFNRNIVPPHTGNDDLYVPLDVMLSWLSSSSKAIPVFMKKRTDGSSNYTIQGLFRHATNAITGYSIAPLRLVSVMGLITFIFSFGILITTLIQYFLGNITVAGFPTIAIMISMFAGINLLSLGIIGEYLGRLHMRSMGRPRYVIRDEI